jgi:hypothetical protein
VKYNKHCASLIVDHLCPCLAFLNARAIKTSGVWNSETTGMKNDLQATRLAVY